MYASQASEERTMEILDARRLTGPNLLLNRTGAVLDVRLDEDGAAARIAAWERRARQLLDAVGWNGEELAVRRFAGGASLALSAPLDALEAAVELAERAWELAGTEDAEPAGVAAEALRRAIAAESRPALRALHAAARARGVSFLADDELATVGLGAGSRSWPVDALPSPAEVPWAEVYDVPAVLITGTNGKSTTVRLLAAIATAAGFVTGTTSTDGVTVAGAYLDRDDFSGPGGARILLRDRRVEIAVLETARGGLLRRGLALDRVRAAAVTNIAADHLGDYGVATVDELAEVKMVVAGAVPPEGRLVVNADDPRLVALAPRRGIPLIWFSLDPGSSVVASHRAAGGDSAWLAGTELMLARGGRVETVTDLARVPVTVGGAALYNAANALAAIGLAAALELPVEAMARGLAALSPDPEGNPGRANLFTVGGAQVLVDYAHNPHGLEALAGFAGQLARRTGGRRLLTLSQAGDRTDEDIRDLARAGWKLAPDWVILKELPDMLRGRAAGEITALLEGELLRLGLPPERLERADSEVDAVRQALAWAEPGDLLVLLVHQQREAVLAMLCEAAATPLP
jgi:cyanophycin synthetase